MRGATPEQLAHAVHEHVGKRIRMHAGQWTFGVVQSVQGTSPPTVTLTLGGSSTAIPGIRYCEAYNPVGGDTVVVLSLGRGDWLVFDGLAE